MSGPEGDKFTFEVLPPGFVHVATAGFWSEADASRYIAELRRHTDDLRSRHGFSLVLVDGRNTVVQSAKVMELVADIQSVLIVDPRDRAAYVVPNSLAKLQAQRLSTTDQLKVFTSPDEARTWVLGWHSAQRGA